ncbi:mechanosensitive ion channel family protein [Cognatilysobacter segetis]|uniref:mechanosensitive ion channel family protein n=1 Tax=Cognatilysobacter segetis TaxID=2492394 RepID=UPI00105CFA69|nr:mechanosensitive ion channel domain-containing protein [Lysobacter segetis]
MPHAQASRELHAAGERVRDAANDGWLGVQPFLDYELVHVAGLELTVGDLASALLLLVAFFVVARMAGRALARYGQREGVDPASVYTVSRVARYALLVIGFLVALEVAGIPVSKFAVFASAVGVGLGFGLQAIFNNFISGLILLFDRSIKIGDFVELESGVHGVVRDIKIRATRISTNDNLNILVPNSEFVSGRVVNWTLLEASRRMRIPFGIAYGTDKELVKKAAIEAACEVPFTLEQEGPRGPQVWLVEFAESRMEFELIVWVNADATKRPSTVKAAYNWALHTALQRHGIAIPFPQRDLHLRSLFGHEDGDAIALLQGRALPLPDTRPPEPEPTPAEHALLADNDALRDVEREIHEDPHAAATSDAPKPEEQ